MYTIIYTYVYVYVYVYIYIYTYIDLSLSLYIYVYVYLNMCIALHRTIQPMKDTHTHSLQTVVSRFFICQR